MKKSGQCLYPPPPLYSNKQNKTDFLLFISIAIGLALLAGFLLPSSVIATSPTEFSFLGQTESPLSYIYSSVCVFVGFFILWPLVIYKMFSGKVRDVMPPLFFVLFVCALLNAYVFKHEYGTLNTAFVLDNASVLNNSGVFILILPFISIILIVFIYSLFRRFSITRILFVIIFSVCLAEGAYGLYKINYIVAKFAAYSKATEIERKEIRNINASDGIEPIYHLSKDKQNVVILWLDRGISSFLPLILNQFPDLKDKYNGFTFYPNTLTLAASTIVATPSIYAGYEYSPEKINKRNDELLREKHNEVQLVPGIIFKAAGFDVLFSDPPWSNYYLNKWHDDFTAFDQYDIKATQVYGTLTSRFIKEKGVSLIDADKICRSRIKDFSIL